MRIDFNNKVIEGSAKRKTVFDCQIPDEAKAVIIFAHGYKGYKDWGAWNLMQDAFVQANYGFVKFNMSHNGGTVDQPIDFPDLEAFGKNRYSYEVNDLKIVIEEVHRMIHQELELSLPIYLIGHSRGGGIALLTAASNPYLSKIVTLAGISDIASRFPKDDALRDWELEGVMFIENGRTQQKMPHYYSFYQDFIKNEDDLTIQTAVEQLNKPLLIVHGDMDLTVSISEGQQLVLWGDKNKKLERLCIIKGAGHTFGAVHPWESNVLPEDLKVAVHKIIEFFDH